jgi:hypothetical protein
MAGSGSAMTLTLLGDVAMDVDRADSALIGWAGLQRAGAR